MTETKVISIPVITLDDDANDNTIEFIIEK